MSNEIFEERKAFNFYRSYYETSLMLPKKDRAEFLEAVINFQFTGDLVEPKSKMALFAFRTQFHSIKRQTIGYQKGKQTYPNGNPTKGDDKGIDKGTHKEVQVQEQGEVQEQEENNRYSTATDYNKISFASVSNRNDFFKNFTGNKKYFLLANRFWRLWKTENPNHKTLNDAKIGKWVDAIRLIIEVDKQSVERLIVILSYMEQSQKNILGFDRFWLENTMSVPALRKTNKNGEYRIDKIVDRANAVIEKNKDFGRLVETQINKFNEGA